MEEKEQPKIEVKVSAKVAIPFWTAGAMYTAGILLSQSNEVFFAEPWYVQTAVWLLMYALWPLFLGLIHSGGF